MELAMASHWRFQRFTLRLRLPRFARKGSAEELLKAKLITFCKADNRRAHIGEIPC
jgi:hypothetical protein